MDDPKFWFLVGTYLLGGVVFWFLVGWTLSQRMKEITEESNQKIGKVYERFDAYKHNIENKLETGFVRKDICLTKHDNVAEAFRDLKSELILLRKTLEELLKKWAEKN